MSSPTSPSQTAPGGALNAEMPVLVAAANHVDQTNSDIGALLSSVRGTVQQLGTGTWQGSAALAFGRVMSDWDGAVARLNTALAGIAEQLRLNSTHFGNEEEINTAAINRVATAGPLNL